MSSYIKANGRLGEDELDAKLEEYRSDRSLLFCIYTNRFCCTLFRPITDMTHLLEIRLFDENGELKAVRANIGAEFVWRYISDECVEEDCTYNEIQYLDTDSTRTSGTDYAAIGGGHYEMPEPDLERVLIRYYGEYDADGMLGVKDHRIVKLLRKGEE